MADRLSALYADREAHRHWLLAEGQALLDHYRASRVPNGFGALDAKGQLTSQTAGGVITTRMVHSYSLAALMGIPGSAPLADHGVAALLDGPLRDQANGGWFEQEGDGGWKQAYLHAFVGLAASSALIAGRPRAEELLQAATDAIDRHFWLEGEGVMASSFSPDWSEIEAYRGANANMHSVEAFMALADATGDDRWIDRTLQIVTRFVHDIPAAHDGRLPEHFAPDWTMLPQFNADKPTDDLRPYGLTPGHFMEWAALTLKLEVALKARGRAVPDWLLQDATALFDRALKIGWAPDGKPGMVYTVGFDDEIVVGNRPFWVHGETTNAAYLLLRRTGEARFDDVYRMVWDYIAAVLIDRKDGSWRNEVDAEGRPTGAVYPLREDLYHNFQATLTPLLPPCASLAGGLAG